MPREIKKENGMIKYQTSNIKLILQPYEYNSQFKPYCQNRYYMKIRVHNSSIETSCEQPPVNEQEKVTRRRGNKNLKEIGGKNKENLRLNVEKDDKMKKKDQVRVQTRVQTREKYADKDPLADYEADILRYIKQRQEEQRILPQSIRNHQSFGPKSRRTKIKYFFKVAQKYKLERTTIHLAVFYLDSYLQEKSNIDKDQVVYSAQAALFIAMKYEEIYPPELYEWSSHCKQIIEAEADILKTLDFRLARTTLEHYNQYFLSKIPVSTPNRRIIEQMMDVSLFDQMMHKEKPYDLALGIFYSIIKPQKVEEKMSMNLKWMLERCQESMEWLQEHKKY